MEPKEESKNYTPLEISDTFLQLDTKGQKTLIALLNSKTITEPAKSLRITRDALYYRMDKYNLRSVLEKIPEQALDALRLASVKAADVLVEELSNSRNKVHVATEILDRVGLSGKKETMGLSVKEGDKEVKFIITRGY